MPTLTTVHQGHMLFSTDIGEHTVECDVALSMGGADRAPTSPQYFIASLGSCIGTFVSSYCRQAGLDDTDLRVEIDFELLEDPTRLGNLKARVVLPHADVKGRKQALHRAAEQCPVHNTIRMFEGVELEIVGG